MNQQNLPNIETAAETLTLLSQIKTLKSQLDETERQLEAERRMFDTGMVVVFRWKNAPGWPVEYVSSNVDEIFGYTSQNFLDSHITYKDIIAPQDFKRVASEVKAATVNNRSWFKHEPYRIIHKQGHTVWLQDFTTIIRDASGKAVQYLGYVVDITNRIETEQALQQQLLFSKAINLVSEILFNEERPHRILQELVRVAGETLQVDRCIVFSTDYEQGRMIGLSKWLNPNLVESSIVNINYPIEKYALSLQFMEETHQPLESHHHQPSPYLVQDGAAEFLHQNRNISSLLWYPFAFRLSGYYFLAFNQVYETRIWTEQELAFIEAIAQQVNIALLKIRFLTAQQEATAELLRLAAVVEQTGEMIIITDTQGLIEYVNPAFEKATGFSMHEVAGLSPYKLKGHNPANTTYETLWTELSIEQSRRLKFTSLRKDGSEFEVEGTIFPIKDRAGKTINYCQISTDITREQKLEAQLLQSQKIEAVGRLAGGIAHDFNNLLTVINGYAGLSLIKAAPDTPLYRDLEQILKAGEKASYLTHQLLAFSRKEVYQAQVIDLNEIVTDAYSLYRRLIGENITISTRLNPNVFTIQADKGQVEQVLMNLVINARDAINELSVTAVTKKITIETEPVILDETYVANHPEARPGPHTVLVVSDTGIGIDEQTANLIFDPFFTTKEVGKGTGLGLATVYGIVTQSAGHINVASQPGEGTTIRIYWPAFASPPPEQHPNAPKAETPGGKETILLVEDDNTVRQFTLTVLQNLGYTVHSAEQGQEALNLINQNKLKVDLLLTDVIMPVMDGKELAQIIQQTSPQTKILFFSGYTDSHIGLNDIFEMGGDIIAKPFTVEALAQKIRERLD